MLLSRNVGISFHPYFNFFHVPFGTLLRSWVSARLSPTHCRVLLEDLIRSAKIPEQLFRPQAIEEGAMVATPSLLFPSTDHWLLTFSFFSEGRAAWARRFSVPMDVAGAVADLLRSATQTQETEVLQEISRELDDDEEFCRQLMTWPAKSRQRWCKVGKAGIYRREHASLVIRSQTTTLLLDPIALMGDRLPRLCEVPVLPEEIDGLLITHTHEDHWQFATVLYHARREDLPIVVPHVPRANLLSPEVPADELRLAGLNALDPAWNTTITIGDIEIDILPFYGEQPTRDAPGPPEGIRNWGNCYRFNTPQFSAIVLVDTGADPAGDMREVMRASRMQRGSVDVVLSCSREFASPFFLGLPTYFATLPFSRLQALFAQQQCDLLPVTTAGCEGLAELCFEAGARHFLPYAHGFAGCGQPIGDIGWGGGEPAEQEQMRNIREVMRARQVKTLIHTWSPGDMAEISEGHLQIRSHQALLQTT